MVKNENDSVLLNNKREWIHSLNEIKEGDIYQTLDLDHIIRMNKNQKQTLMVKELSAYEELAIILQEINQRYMDNDDSKKIQIISDQKIEYDKIIQAMDVAKEAGFSQINLGQLGS